MKGIYQSVPDCIACMNLGWAPEGACSGCLRLAKERAEEVDILQLGVGLFADKAVTVSCTHLTLPTNSRV